MFQNTHAQVLNAMRDALDQLVAKEVPGAKLPYRPDEPVARVINASAHSPAAGHPHAAPGEPASAYRPAPVAPAATHPPAAPGISHDPACPPVAVSHPPVHHAHAAPKHPHHEPHHGTPIPHPKAHPHPAPSHPHHPPRRMEHHDHHPGESVRPLSPGGKGCPPTQQR